MFSHQLLPAVLPVSTGSTSQASIVSEAAQAWQRAADAARAMAVQVETAAAEAMATGLAGPSGSVATGGDLKEKSPVGGSKRPSPAPRGHRLAASALSDHMITVSYDVPGAGEGAEGAASRRGSSESGYSSTSTRTMRSGPAGERAVQGPDNRSRSSETAGAAGIERRLHVAPAGGKLLPPRPSEAAVVSGPASAAARVHDLIAQLRLRLLSAPLSDVGPAAGLVAGPFALAGTPTNQLSRRRSYSGTDRGLGRPDARRTPTAALTAAQQLRAVERRKEREDRMRALTGGSEAGEGRRGTLPTPAAAATDSAVAAPGAGAEQRRHSFKRWGSGAALGALEGSTPPHAHGAVPVTPPPAACSPGVLPPAVQLACAWGVRTPAEIQADAAALRKASGHLPAGVDPALGQEPLEPDSVALAVTQAISVHQALVLCACLALGRECAWATNPLHVASPGRQREHRVARTRGQASSAVASHLALGLRSLHAMRKLRQPPQQAAGGGDSADPNALPAIQACVRGLCSAATAAVREGVAELAFRRAESPARRATVGQHEAAASSPADALAQDSTGTQLLFALAGLAEGVIDAGGDVTASPIAHIPLGADTLTLQALLQLAVEVEAELTGVPLVETAVEGTSPVAVSAAPAAPPASPSMHLHGLAMWPALSCVSCSLDEAAAAGGRVAGAAASALHQRMLQEELLLASAEPVFDGQGTQPAGALRSPSHAAGPREGALRALRSESEDTTASAGRPLETASAHPRPARDIVTVDTELANAASASEARRASDLERLELAEDARDSAYCRQLAQQCAQQHQQGLGPEAPPVGPLSVPPRQGLGGLTDAGPASPANTCLAPSWRSSAEAEVAWQLNCPSCGRRDVRIGVHYSIFTAATAQQAAGASAASAAVSPTDATIGCTDSSCWVHAARGREVASDAGAPTVSTVGSSSSAGSRFSSHLTHRLTLSETGQCAVGWHKKERCSVLLPAELVCELEQLLVDAVAGGLQASAAASPSHAPEAGQQRGGSGVLSSSPSSALRLSEVGAYDGARARLRRVLVSCAWWFSRVQVPDNIIHELCGALAASAHPLAAPSPGAQARNILAADGKPGASAGSRCDLRSGLDAHGASICAGMTQRTAVGRIVQGVYTHLAAAVAAARDAQTAEAVSQVSGGAGRRSPVPAGYIECLSALEQELHRTADLVAAPKPRDLVQASMASQLQQAPTVPYLHGQERSAGSGPAGGLPGIPRMALLLSANPALTVLLPYLSHHDVGGAVRVFITFRMQYRKQSMRSGARGSDGSDGSGSVSGSAESAGPVHGNGIPAAVLQQLAASAPGQSTAKAQAQLESRRAVWELSCYEVLHTVAALHCPALLAEMERQGAAALAAAADAAAVDRGGEAASGGDAEAEAVVRSGSSKGRLSWLKGLMTPASPASPAGSAQGRPFQPPAAAGTPVPGVGSRPASGSGASAAGRPGFTISRRAQIPIQVRSEGWHGPRGIASLLLTGAERQRGIATAPHATVPAPGTAPAPAAPSDDLQQLTLGGALRLLLAEEARAPAAPSAGTQTLRGSASAMHATGLRSSSSASTDLVPAATPATSAASQPPATTSSTSVALTQQPQHLRHHKRNPVSRFLRHALVDCWTTVALTSQAAPAFTLEAAALDPGRQLAIAAATHDRIEASPDSSPAPPTPPAGATPSSPVAVPPARLARPLGWLWKHERWQARQVAPETTAHGSGAAVSSVAAPPAEAMAIAPAVAASAEGEPAIPRSMSMRDFLVEPEAPHAGRAPSSPRAPHHSLVRRMASQWAFERAVADALVQLLLDTAEAPSTTFAVRDSPAPASARGSAGSAASVASRSSAGRSLRSSRGASPLASSASGPGSGGGVALDSDASVPSAGSIRLRHQHHVSSFASSTSTASASRTHPGDRAGSASASPGSARLATTPQTGTPSPSTASNITLSSCIEPHDWPPPTSALLFRQLLGAVDM